MRADERQRLGHGHDATPHGFPRCPRDVRRGAGAGAGRSPERGVNTWWPYGVGANGRSPVRRSG
ncbi:hypothetical protein SGM_1217 [Streptomyces griseoaurantiacus M045]|uniref:Uncharacterized protein n=1 Tax=Streptomyces griseoaurantiacus M045 TaxID=996637 RepID=F3NDK3_9ACTN|nr:hypothetical protein SGM_1217 [Streptomyces griseoaurantiacus M045]